MAKSYHEVMRELSTAAREIIHDILEQDEPQGLLKDFDQDGAKELVERKMANPHTGNDGRVWLCLIDDFRDQFDDAVKTVTIVLQIPIEGIEVAEGQNPFEAARNFLDKMDPVVVKDHINYGEYTWSLQSKQ